MRSSRPHRAQTLLGLTSALVLSGALASAVVTDALGQGWQRPQVLGKVTPVSERYESEAKALGSDARGNVVLVTRVGRGAEARIVAFERPRGRSFGAPQPLSVPGPVVLESLWVGPDGRALVLWAERNDPLQGGQRFSRLFASVRPAGGSFGPPEVIPSPERGYQPVGASDRRGNVVVLFAVPSRRQVGCEVLTECPIQGDLVVSRRPASGGFSLPGRLIDVAIPLGESVLDSKDRLVVPIAKAEYPDDRLEVMRLPVRGGGFSLKKYSAYDANDDEVALTANRQGDTAVAFVDVDGVLRVASSHRGGSFRRAVAVADDGPPSSPDIAVDGVGRALVTWSVTRDGRQAGRQVVRVVESSRSGRFGRTRSVSRVGLDTHPEDHSVAIAPRIALDPRGRATIVWSRQGRGLRSVIEARARPRPGRFGRVAIVARARFGLLDEPLVANVRVGGALVVWELLARGEDRGREGPILQASVRRRR